MQYESQTFPAPWKGNKGTIQRQGCHCLTHLGKIWEDPSWEGRVISSARGTQNHARGRRQWCSHLNHPKELCCCSKDSKPHCCLNSPRILQEPSCSSRNWHHSLSPGSRVPAGLPVSMPLGWPSGSQHLSPSPLETAAKCVLGTLK